MESLRELYKIGVGPSSSHTMGPQRAAKRVLKLYPDAAYFHVDLYGSLSLTGKGHLTDYIIEETFSPKKVTFSFKSDSLPFHPNGMIIHVFDNQDKEVKAIEVYSVGGGSILFKGDMEENVKQVYMLNTMDEILEYVDKSGMSLYDYILENEDENIEEFLHEILDAMFLSVHNGLKKEGTIHGKLKLKRVAKSMYQHAQNTRREADRERLFITSYAYAVSEENADGGQIVTAPTCGASGIMPAILYYCYKQLHVEKKDLIKALAIGGLFGNIVKTNATISGADGGCQAEVGTACAMAAATMAYIYELNNSLIEYAAEMGLEHNLGLTCDPVGGYVQIPCIERNGYGSLRALDAAMMAKQLGYMRKNKVSFDAIVRVMKETGKDLSSAYKETSLGGLAKEFGL
ncbi:MAG: L-serine ammonia-lyase, iron-sulfur-dependent, subunit alpha [Coprobacillus sp.]